MPCRGAIMDLDEDLFSGIKEKIKSLTCCPSHKMPHLRAQHTTCANQSTYDEPTRLLRLELSAIGLLWHRRAYELTARNTQIISYYALSEC